MDSWASGTHPVALASISCILRESNTDTPMTVTELKALAQDLRNERTEALRAAEQAQDCLNEVQRKLALLKLQAQVDTPMADLYGG